MQCPFCRHKELKVIDSREAPEMNAIKRRRECLGCLQRCTTFETIELTMQVHKRDGKYEDFQVQKLIKGMEAACRHSRVSHDQVIVIANRITEQLMQHQVREISTRELGEIVMEQLLALDPIAYIRYACVYNRFTDVTQLMEALKSVQHKGVVKDGAEEVRHSPV